MRNEDLLLISKLGQALYANRAQAETRSLETVAAISTLAEISDDQFLERALGLMLLRAERDGLRAAADSIESPFFRLTPKERFVLFLLHSGRVSYKKLSRLMDVTPEDVQTTAWIARTRVASSPEVRAKAPHPSGSSRLKHACPDFNLERPWTQRLLDDEMGRTELAFLQNHTAVCADCQRALAMTRDLYYAVEKWIPLLAPGTLAPDLGTTMRKALRDGRIKSGNLPHDLTFGETMRLFFSRRENVIWIGIFAAAMAAISYFKN